MEFFSLINELILDYYQAIIYSIFFFLIVVFFLIKNNKNDTNSEGNIGTADGSSVCDSSYMDCGGDGGG